jgi:hypothetical protein
MFAIYFNGKFMFWIDNEYIIRTYINMGCEWMEIENEDNIPERI